MYESASLFREKRHVGIKKVGSEPIHHQVGFHHLSGQRILNFPMICGILNQHTGPRPVAISNVLKKREDHRDDDPVLHTKN